MYQVLENMRPAEYPMGPIHWTNSTFSTFQEAIDYAKAWLLVYADAIPKNWEGKPINYNGHGDSIQIYRSNG